MSRNPVGGIDFLGLFFFFLETISTALYLPSSWSPRTPWPAGGRRHRPLLTLPKPEPRERQRGHGKAQPASPPQPDPPLPSPSGRRGLEAEPREGARRLPPRTHLRPLPAPQPTASAGATERAGGRAASPASPRPRPAPQPSQCPPPARPTACTARWWRVGTRAAAAGWAEGVRAPGAGEVAVMAASCVDSFRASPRSLR